MKYQTQLRNKNRGYMNLIIAEEDVSDPDFALIIEYSITPSFHYSITPPLRNA
jgi:hypothetical protein